MRFFPPFADDDDAFDVDALMVMMVVSLLSLPIQKTLVFFPPLPPLVKEEEEEEELLVVVAFLKEEAERRQQRASFVVRVIIEA